MSNQSTLDEVNKEGWPLSPEEIDEKCKRAMERLLNDKIPELGEGDGE